MFFSVPDRGKFSTMVYNWPHDGKISYLAPATLYFLQNLQMFMLLSLPMVAEF
jgi:hypothetical protein